MTWSLSFTVSIWDEAQKVNSLSSDFNFYLNSSGQSHCESCNDIILHGYQEAITSTHWLVAWKELKKADRDKELGYTDNFECHENFPESPWWGRIDIPKTFCTPTQLRSPLKKHYTLSWWDSMDGSMLIITFRFQSLGMNDCPLTRGFVYSLQSQNSMGKILWRSHDVWAFYLYLSEFSANNSHRHLLLLFKMGFAVYISIY